MSSEILVVDDEDDIRKLIADVLSDEGYETRDAGSAEAALAAIEARRPTLVLLDIWLQGSAMDGIGVLREIRRVYHDLPVIMISGHGSIETAVEAIKIGALDFIEKPFETDRLLISVNRAIELARLQRENTELLQRAGGDIELIGESQAIVGLRQTIDRVGPTGSRVLITGPAGSGKEVVARLVHQQSRRNRAPFVVVNAAAMTPDRVEVELFGMEAGASQPSSPRKIGSFEQAHNGTLLLDEVADMPIATQGKILRVLQEQTFTRVGGNKPVQVDVRVIASTSRDLVTEIREKRFREDLFYRLNVVPIRVPSLKERREDIPVLANHFMGRSASASGLPTRELAEETVAVMQTCDWPGNIRQFRNLIDWLLIMAPGDGGSVVSADMLPPELMEGYSAISSGANGTEFMGLSLREARELFEKQYLQAQIMRFGNNISKTANYVGMERSALHRKLKTLGVTGDDKS